MKAKKTTKTVTAAEIRKLLQSDDVLGRMEGVGRTIYGPEWITPLADTLGVARQTLHNWLSKASPTPTNLDEQLLGVVDEAIVAAALKARAEAASLASAADVLKARIQGGGRR